MAAILFAAAMLIGGTCFTAFASSQEQKTPIYAESLNSGRYEIEVTSSASMFRIVHCELVVSGSDMTAEMTLSGKGYEKLYMGTSEQAEKADESEYIFFTEDADGKYTYTVPVEALDKETDCAAYSFKKQRWYDRKLVFRADSLADDAFKESRSTSAEALSLADGEYTIEVKLEGGSGKASVQSPAKLTVSSGKATAEIIWGSNHYDYMIVADEKYLPVSTEEFSVFEIPVTGFDYPMPVSADTTAMSTPHEIAYTLYFDSSTIQ